MAQQITNVTVTANGVPISKDPVTYYKQLQDAIKAKSDAAYKLIAQQKAASLAAQKKSTGGGSSGGGGSASVIAKALAASGSGGNVNTPNAEDVAKLIPSGPEIMPFMWNQEQAERDAMEKLRPYYEELLAEAGGDVELAKKRLLEDYDNGNRQTMEDFTTITERATSDYILAQGQREQDVATKTERTAREYATNKQQQTEDFLSQSQEYARLVPEEKAKVLDALNRRGLLQSSIRTAEQANLTARQQARQEAIQKALERKDQLARTTVAQSNQDLARAFERAQLAGEQGLSRTQEDAQRKFERANLETQTGYSRNVEDIDIAYPRYVRKLEDEKAQRALEMANMAQNRAFDKWKLENQATLNTYNA
jgi:hypothetical protein